mmetsp:Transcript_28744/g.64888  ORF Transcript_28744/g.64888 Transcript_28744/m.64888 type:complete len:351 (-) Transcript_28744:506-1558(-)
MRRRFEPLTESKDRTTTTSDTVRRQSSAGAEPLPRYLSLLLLALSSLLLIFVLAAYPDATASGGALPESNNGLLRNQISTKERQPRRIVGVGDTHGDREALVRALRLANIVDESGMEWIGGPTSVVQIGDLLNKSELRDEDTLTYIAHIEKKARDAGGSVIVTVGDHDLHNVPKLWKSILPDKPFPLWMRALHIEDRTLFVHGSLSRSVFHEIGGNVTRLDEEVATWLAGTGIKPPWIGRGDGPVWSRLYSDNGSDEHPDCEELSRLLDELNVDRMVVGHTVKRNGITSICDGKAWRIDVGLSRTESRAGKIGASEVLEIVDGSRVEVLNTETKLKSWLPTNRYGGQQQS